MKIRLKVGATPLTATLLESKASRDFASLLPLTLTMNDLGQEPFFSHVHLHGGPAPVRRYLPELIDLVWKRKINPGKVFDLTLPLEQVAEGYRAMDERRAIKTLLRP